MSADISATAGHVSAYSKDAVDDFLAAAEAERRMLLAAIAEADERTRRARAAVGMQRVMVSMLLETQRDLGELRQSAEREAAEILAAAEIRAQEIVDQARMHGPPEADLTCNTIDLPIEEIRYSQPVGSRESDTFFSYLRGALVDDEPLGPRFA